MLVNANDFPGPALLQGIGLILVVVWFVLVQPALDRRKDRLERQQRERDAVRKAPPTRWKASSTTGQTHEPDYD